MDDDAEAFYCISDYGYFFDTESEKYINIKMRVNIKKCKQIINAKNINYINSFTNGTEFSRSPTLTLSLAPNPTNVKNRCPRYLLYIVGASISTISIVGYLLYSNKLKK